MTSLGSASQPILRYQTDPLLNVSPLIDLHSECLTHVVDTDGLFQLQGHKSPIILSHKRGILNSSLSYQSGFARVRSPRCLLTIVAIFFSWNYSVKTLREHVIPQKILYTKLFAKKPATNFARILPQSVIILSNKNARSVDLCKNVVYHLGRPLFFTLQLNENLNSFHRILGVLGQDMFGTPAFNCSTFESCRDKMDQTTNFIANDFRTSWEFWSNSWNFQGGNPFSRGSQAGMDQAIGDYILGPNPRRFTNQHVMPPWFEKKYSDRVSEPVDLIRGGRTASVKFVTTAGVFTPKLSYQMYLSPFLQTVWLVMIASAGISLVTMLGAIRMKSTEGIEIGLLDLALELATWLFAVTIGQYKHSDIPLISKHLLCKQVVWIVTPVVVSWFILSTFIVNVYSAVFSSEATRSFYYETSYTELLQLPLDSWMYILVNESSLRNYSHFAKITDSCEVSTRSARKYCDDGIVPAACIIPSATYYTYSQLNKDTAKSSKLATFMLRMSYLCANTESLSRVLLHSNKSLTFLITDHDFQKYWQLFVKVMQSNPNIKLANNFYSQDSSLSHPVVFQFTSGLHHALKGSGVERFKLLLSSGIYNLWEKWRRIKFTDGGLQCAEHKLRKENRIDPLSFSNSGTMWIFCGQGVAWLVAIGILMVEIIFRVQSSLIRD